MGVLSVMNQKITLNVSGTRYTIEETKLRRYPKTLLGSGVLSMFYDSGKKEYFFDRDPDMFRHILNYYRQGKIHFSKEDPMVFPK